MKNNIKNISCLWILFLIVFSLSCEGLSGLLVKENSTGTFSIDSAEDSYVHGLNAGTNYGNDALLVVKYNADPNLMRKSYFKFDISSLADSRTVTSARFFVYAKGDDSAQTVDAYGVNDDSWTELSIVYNNRPLSSVFIDQAVIPDDAYAWHSFDVTSYTAGQYDVDDIVSLCVEDIPPGSSGSGLSYYYSRESADNHPFLEIVLE
ncbi:MAG: DNRLRE domain-containing protein [bacterium]|nr:DNRLRE domain-containing protein [bacterium]